MTLDHTMNREAVESLARETRQKVEELRDQIVAGAGAMTTVRLCAAFDAMDAHLDVSLGLLGLYESVHPDEGLRNAAEAGRADLSNLASRLGLDKELYDALAPRGTSLEPDPLTRRFVEHTLRDFRRAGVDKDLETRDRIEQLKKELVGLSQTFGRNIRSDTRFVEVEESKLEGLPRDYIEARKKDGAGTFKISTDYPDFVPVMSYAKDTDLRRRLSFEYQNRAYPQNEKVLADILQKRFELVELLGYPSYAAYAAEDKMIRSADAIAGFIEEIFELSSARCEKDYASLLERKRKDDPGAEVLHDYERAYYAELVRAETLGYDSQEIRPYLEYTKVKQGVLDIVSRVFGLELSRSGEPAWHPAVETYDVYEGGKRLGRFHLDMHPREGKYKHAAMFPIRTGAQSGELPEASLVCNFSDPGVGRGPALMEHSDVVTFFHEMGHLLHHILGGGQKYVRFGGVSTEWDFVEVPSQLFEEWAYSYETLHLFAAHHETGQKIPEELVDRLRAARSFGRGVAVRQQMFYAALALRYHTIDPRGLDPTAVLEDVQKSYSPFPREQGTHFFANFGHLDGYSALYYTYMWSLVIVRDFFETFRERGLLDAESAIRYRKTVLSAGGSKDAAELVRDFLGRDYSLEAYRHWLEE